MGSPLTRCAASPALQGGEDANPFPSLRSALGCIAVSVLITFWLAPPAPEQVARGLAEPLAVTVRFAAHEGAPAPAKSSHAPAGPTSNPVGAQQRRLRKPAAPGFNPLLPPLPPVEPVETDTTAGALDTLPPQPEPVLPQGPPQLGPELFAGPEWLLPSDPAEALVALRVDHAGIVRETKLVKPSLDPTTDMLVLAYSFGRFWGRFEPPLQEGEHRWVPLRYTAGASAALP